MKKIKEFLKDPKKKALTQLGLYGVFFIFVFILIGSGNDNRDSSIINESKTSTESYADMTSYDYKVTYTNIDKIDVIEGTFYKDAALFTYNNLKYYYEDVLYVINNDTYTLSNIEYNVSKIFNKNLHTIFEKLTEESKTTYKDGTVVKNYTIESNLMFNYLYETDSTYDSLVSVSITEKDELITNIVIDLTNLSLNLNKIEIEYSNIDNIENLEFNKNIYTYEENL